jgi:hypothetical protein
MNKRPLSVTVISCLFVVTGAVGVASHLTNFNAQHLFQSDLILICLVGLVAIVSGVYMFRGSNWARWLALLWMASHVVISAFHSFIECLIHGLFLAVLSYFLMRPQVSAYFNKTRMEGR